MKVKDCVCAMKIISRLIWIYSYTLRHSDTPTHTYAYASITFIEMKARWKYVDVCTNDKWKIALRFRKIFEVYKAWKEKISFYVLMEDRYIHILCNIFHFPFHLISIHHTDDDDESGRDEQKKYERTPNEWHTHSLTCCSFGSPQMNSCDTHLKCGSVPSQC